MSTALAVSQDAIKLRNEIRIPLHVVTYGGQGISNVLENNSPDRYKVVFVRVRHGVG